MAAIVPSPSPGACTTSTPSAAPSSTPALALPSSTMVTGGSRRPAATAARTCSVNRRAAPGRSRHHPVGREPMTLAASITSTRPASRPDRLSHPLRSVGGMDVQDARQVREAADLLAAAVAETDLGSMLPATQRELVALGERIERTGRTLKSMAAAKVAESTVGGARATAPPRNGWPAPPAPHGPKRPRSSSAGVTCSSSRRSLGRPPPASSP